MTLRFQAKHLTGFTADSPLKPFVFPDGALHIKGGDKQRGQFQYQIADVRGLSHDELFALVMWSDVCRDRGEKTVLILPYLPGARADRGVPTGADDYAWFISGGIDADQVITLDPHSDIMPNLINNLTVFPFERIIKREIQDGSSDSKPQPYVGVIAPDKGAVDRATRAAKVMGVPVYRAEKDRDFETGKLSGFHMVDELPAEGKLLIVDDICDGGGTFIGLAEAIDLPAERLDLWVTHGVFSKGVRYLAYRFGEIHTTNSYTSREALFEQHRKDHDVYELTNTPEDGGIVHIHDITPYLYAEINV